MMANSSEPTTLVNTFQIIFLTAVLQVRHSYYPQIAGEETKSPTDEATFPQIGMVRIGNMAQESMLWTCRLYFYFILIFYK